ncbi:MAG: CAP domain-containing protein [Brumimicrobium sp.]
MKFFLFIIALFQGAITFSQSETEKEILVYINKVRTNPQQFLEEVAEPYIIKNDYSRNRYARSLIKTLRNSPVLTPLKFDTSLQLLAESFAEEAGKKGWTGHVKVDQRFKKHADHIDITAENLQFGFNEALDIVMDLLIDFDIPSYGHRNNILDADFSIIGVAIDSHKEYDYITVMAFGGYDEE